MHENWHALPRSVKKKAVDEGEEHGADVEDASAKPVCIDMCIDMYRHIDMSRHVYGHVYRHVWTCV